VLAPVAQPRPKAVLQQPREAFEASWAEAALVLLDEIPSRA
jgi:hypothetical protein